MLWFKNKLTLSFVINLVGRATSLSRNQEPLGCLLQFMHKLVGAQRTPGMRTLPESYDLRLAFSGPEIFPPIGSAPSRLPFLH